MDDVKVLRLHPFDEGANTVFLNFMFDNVIIGEIQISCSQRPVNALASRSL